MRRFTLSIMISALAVLSLWGGAAWGQTSITDLYNTGVAAGAGFSGGGVLADNAVDPHYTVAWDGGGVGPTAIVATSAGGFPIPPWIGDSAISAWTTPAANTLGPNDSPPTALYFTYSTSFTTPGPGLVTIGGMISADNNVIGAIIDGGPLLSISNTSSFGGFDPFLLTSTVAAGGAHTLDYRVQNGIVTEVGATGPTGLRIEYSEATIVPEPSSLFLAGLGALGLGIAALIRRRSE